jgi:hypothetical protein
MALTDYTISDADIGSALDPPNGFLVNLSQTAPAVPDGEPQFSASKQVWLTGYFQIRGERDIQAVYCSRSGTWVPQWIGDQRILISNASFPYAGRLRIICVPKGSAWSVTLSDVPTVRAPSATPGWAPSGMWGSYPDYRHGVRPGP